MDVNHYSRHVSICDKSSTPIAFALTVAPGAQSVTERRRSPIRYTSPYHLSRGEARLNEPRIAATLTPERSPQHVAHLTASHRIWRKGGAGFDAFRIPDAALWPSGLPRGPRPGAGAGGSRHRQLRPPGCCRGQATGQGAALRPGAALAAGWGAGQGFMADDFRWRLERPRCGPGGLDRGCRGRG